MIIRSLKLFLLFVLVTGLFYPFLVTGFSFIIMNEETGGGLIVIKDKIIGARQIAQKFESERYFWPRPSAVDYNPLPSGGSNLGPTSLQLKKIIEERRNKILAAHPRAEPVSIPSELLYASASGLDPHISQETAIFQIDRVSKGRGFNRTEKSTLEKLIRQATHNRTFGFIGEPSVNVLELNILLDELHP